MENNVNKRIDEFQSEMEHKFDNLQYSISRLTIQQHVHLEEVNPEEECLIDTAMEEKCKQQKEETSPMLTGEGNGKEEMEEPQKSTAQATKNPLPEAPTIKATPSLPSLQNLKKVVAIAQTFATTSKKMVAADVAWHSGWFGCGFGFVALEPWHFYAPPVSAASKGLRNRFEGSSVSPTFYFQFSYFFS